MSQGFGTPPQTAQSGSDITVDGEPVDSVDFVTDAAAIRTDISVPSLTEFNALADRVTALEGGNTAPGQVTGVNATPGDAEVDLDWTAPASDGGSAITTYLVQYRTPAGSGSYTTFSHSASTTPSITVTGLTDDSEYEFKVSAVNVIGTGIASSTVTATPTATPAGFTPPATNLVYSFVADDLTGVSDGDQLWKFPNTGSGGTSGDITSGGGSAGAGSPIYHTGGIDGHAYLSFDGSNDLLVAPVDVTVPATHTLWIIAKVTAAGTYGNLFGLGYDGTYFQLDNTTGKMYGRAPGTHSAGANQTAETAASIVGAWHLYELVFDSTADTLALYVDGTIVGTTVAATVDPDTPGSLYFSSGSGGVVAMDTAGAGVYSTAAASAALRTAVASAFPSLTIA